MSGLAIEVKGLTRRFGDVVAVDGLDLQVARGECVGLLGPNGAGKTTTLEILEGLQRQTSGHVRVLGRSWESEGDAIRARIGVQLQEVRYQEVATVEELLRLFRSFYREGRQVDEVLELVNLREKRHSRVGTLSGGQRQRFSLATALVSSPELLFLDEPTTGLDPHSRRALWDIVKGLKASGCTVLLTTHYMEEATQLCDRIVIINRGRTVAEGTPAALVDSLGAQRVIEFKAEPMPEVQVLTALPGAVGFQPSADGGLLRVSDAAVGLPALVRCLEAHGSRLLWLTTREATLEDVFLHFSGQSFQEAA